MKKQWITALVVLFVAGAAIIGAILFARSTTDTPSNTNNNQAQVTIYFGNSQMNPNAEECAAVYPVTRTVSADSPALQTMRALAAGPTATEATNGYYSSFSAATANTVRSVQITNQTAYVDLQDVRTLMPNASASCASAQLLAEIDQTLKAFAPKALVAINGDPRTFYEWLQLDCPAGSNDCDASQFNQ